MQTYLSILLLLGVTFLVLLLGLTVIAAWKEVFGRKRGYHCD